MSKQIQLSTSDIDQITAYLLNTTPLSPTLDCITRLVFAYIRKIPWESASRIARKSQNTNPEDCANWPIQFWQDAMNKGTGGTCFESNYAFFGLLQALGFEGYLTINNMGDSVGCHSAIVLMIESQKYLVDVGLPLHAPIPFSPGKVTTQASQFHDYTITPQQNNHFLIERNRHPRSDCFTLVDVPVSDKDYRAALINDYDENGLFLDQVIVSRIVDGKIWRFKADSIPYHLESFVDEDKSYHLLGNKPEPVAEQVSAKFEIEESIFLTALQLFP